MAKKNKGNKKCPRCSGTVAFALLVKSSSFATGIAKCTSCGRSWGATTFEIEKFTLPSQQLALAKVRLAWNNRRDNT